MSSYWILKNAYRSLPSPSYIYFFVTKLNFRKIISFFWRMIFEFCFLALLVFYVPSESGEKVTLGISALLSMTVFLMTIRETLPPTEKTPLISKFFIHKINFFTFAGFLIKKEFFSLLLAKRLCNLHL